MMRYTDRFLKLNLKDLSAKFRIRNKQKRIYHYFLLKELPPPKKKLKIFTNQSDFFFHSPKTDVLIWLNPSNHPQTKLLLLKLSSKIFPVLEEKSDFGKCIQHSRQLILKVHKTKRAWPKDSSATSGRWLIWSDAPPHSEYRNCGGGDP